MISFNKRLIMTGVRSCVSKHCMINNNYVNKQINYLVDNRYANMLYKSFPVNRFYFSSSKNNNNKSNQQQHKQQQQQQSTNINSNQQQPTTNNNPQQQQQQQQQQFTQQQQHLINTHQPDQLFNLLINIQPKHNFQKDLIISKKAYQKTTQQLRASILFQDLLKSQITILIYDTKGKPYTHFWIKNIFNILFLALTIWFFKSLQNLDPKNKVLIERTTAGKLVKNIFIGFAVWFLITGLYRYLKFQRRFVQSIIYDTKTQSFILKKRGFFGSTLNQQISRFKLVYTQNEFLNKKGTNYFNLDTKEQYSIPYKDSWIKQDLFSHLIAQRIKI